MITEGVFLESTSLGDDRLVVESLTGTSELNRGFRFTVRLSIPNGSFSAEDLERVLETEVSLFFIEGETELQRFHGMVAELTAEPDVEHTRTDLFLEIVPRTALLVHRRGSQIFLDHSIPGVIIEVLQAAGFVPDVDFAMPLRRVYPGREFVAQHEETDAAFISRLCEAAGITTFFEHRNRRDVLIFTDSSAPFHDVGRVLPVRHKTAHPAAWQVRTTLRRVPAEVEVHDYNYRSPVLDLLEKRPSARAASVGQWTEFGDHMKTGETQRELATIRAEEHASRHHVVEAFTTEASILAGGITTLRDAVGVERRLLLTRVEYRFRQVTGSSGTELGWDNRFHAIPAEVPFRPARTTPTPRVGGLLNAVVDGEIRGDYAELDAAGRYHVRFANDRSGRTDLGATHPVRMMQPHAGSHYGMHFPLRPGTEVLLGFVNADPDRPVIVGTAPNPINTSPVLERNQTQNVLRTGSNNEMVIEDLHGTERIRIHTPHKRSTLQLGADEEPEEGVLLTTEAHVSEVSRLSNNVVTTTQTTLADSSTTVVGRSAIIAAGSPALSSAAEKGIDDPRALSLNALGRDLEKLAQTPAERRAAAESDSEPDEASSDERAANEEGPSEPEEAAGSSLTSARAATAASNADGAVMDLIRKTSQATDETADDSLGRTSVEPLGDPLMPVGAIASEQTAALIGRDEALCYGDRVAALSSGGSAAVVGGRSAVLKSPGEVEVAGAEKLNLTSAGELDVAARTARIVAGYYPEAEAPPLDPAVSLGIMSRNDLRVHSIEDCILLCAKKNLVGSAHTGDIKLTAQKTVALTGGSIVGSAGTISLSSDTTKIKATGDIEITADGDITMKAANVTIEAGTIKLVGTVLVDGDLFVSGNSNL